MDYEFVIQKFSQQFPVSSPQWESIKDIFQLKLFTKGDHFLKAQDNPGQFGLVVEGIFRLYYIDQDGKEWVRNFQATGGLVAAYAESIMGQLSRTYIQALSESKLLVCSFQAFEEKTKNMLEWEVLRRKILEQLYIKKENREYELLHLGASKRYEIFKQEYQHVIHHIPNYHIASYLGITPQALSRLKAQGNT